MTEHEQVSSERGHVSASESEAPDHDPYYCVHDPETGEWLVVLKHLPGYLREAMFDKTEGPDTPQDWKELRGPNWATHMLHRQAEEGSEEAKQSLADSYAVFTMPEGWNEWVEDNFRHDEDPQAPNYYPEYASEPS